MAFEKDIGMKMGIPHLLSCIPMCLTLNKTVNIISLTSIIIKKKRLHFSSWSMIFMMFIIPQDCHPDKVLLRFNTECNQYGAD